MDDDYVSDADRDLGLGRERIAAAVSLLTEAGARRVLDLGCGPGKLIAALVAAGGFAEIVGVDISSHALAIARSRLHLDRRPGRGQRLSRVRLVRGPIDAECRRLTGYDAATLLEVVEHNDPAWLSAIEEALFGVARPALIVATTPNREYNALFPDVGAGRLRDPDHHFEWTRAEAATWAEGVGDRYGYTASLAGIGRADPAAGQPSHLIVFRRTS